MKQKAKSKQKRTSANHQQRVTKMANQGLRDYQQTLRSGEKMQEEASRGWNEMMQQAVSPAEWQKGVANLTVITGNLMPMAQKGMQQMLELMSKNGRTGAELMRKAVDAAQTPVLAESQSKWMEVWTSSLRAVQSNAEAVTRIGTHAIDSWIEFVRKTTDTSEMRVPKAA